MRLLCQIYFQTRIKDRCAEHFLWSWLQLNATLPYWWVNIGSDNVLVSAGNKPLPKPMMTQIYGAAASLSMFLFPPNLAEMFPTARQSYCRVICEIPKRFVHWIGHYGQTIFGEISACDEFWTYCHDRYRYWSQKGSIPLMSRLPWLYWRYCYLSSEIAVDNALTLSVARENKLFPILADCFVFRISYIFLESA